MPAFIHAALVAEYAEDCKVSETPWEFWEFESLDGVWHQAMYAFCFDHALKYRRKLRTIRIGDIDVPEPLREAFPLYRAGEGTYYYVALHKPELECESYWNADEDDLHRLNAGLIHKTAEAARAHAQALIVLNARRDA